MDPVDHSREESTSPTVLIRPAVLDDEMSWRSMWAAYNAFYETTVPERVTDETWRRILDPNTPIGAILATENGVAVGFANYVVQPYTWSERPHCLMEDLFVIPEGRSRGAGRALIQYLIDLCRREEFPELYWITRENNATARRLYDTFTLPDGFIQYTIEVAPEPNHPQ
jgi:GNAT superfamily N-acetyltransferase